MALIGEVGLYLALVILNCKCMVDSNWLRIKASRTIVRPSCYRHNCVQEKFTLTCTETSIEHVFSWPPLGPAFEIPLIPSGDYLNVSLAVIGMDPSFNIIRTCDYSNAQYVENAKNVNLTLNFSSSCFDVTLKVDWIDARSAMMDDENRLTNFDRHQQQRRQQLSTDVSRENQLLPIDHSIIWIVLSLIAVSLILLIIIIVMVRYYRRDDNNRSIDYRSAEAIKQNLYHIKTNKHYYNTDNIHEIRTTRGNANACAL